MPANTSTSPRPISSRRRASPASCAWLPTAAWTSASSCPSGRTTPSLTSPHGPFSPPCCRPACASSCTPARTPRQDGRHRRRLGLIGTLEHADAISLLYNFEANIVSTDPKFAEEVAAVFIATSRRPAKWPLPNGAAGCSSKNGSNCRPAWSGSSCKRGRRGPICLYRIGVLSYFPTSLATLRVKSTTRSRSRSSASSPKTARTSA